MCSRRKYWNFVYVCFVLFQLGKDLFLLLFCWSPRYKFQGLVPASCRLESRTWFFVLCPSYAGWLPALSSPSLSESRNSIWLHIGSAPPFIMPTEMLEAKIYQVSIAKSCISPFSAIRFAFEAYIRPHLGYLVPWNCSKLLENTAVYSVYQRNIWGRFAFSSEVAAHRWNLWAHIGLAPPSFLQSMWLSLQSCHFYTPIFFTILLAFYFFSQIGFGPVGAQPSLKFVHFEPSLYFLFFLRFTKFGSWDQFMTCSIF